MPRGSEGGYLMSDEAMLMMAGIWVAFCCAVSEAALRRQGGVNDDGKADRGTDGLSRGPDGAGLHSHGLDHRADPITGHNEHRSEIIDLEAARDRLALARRARARDLRRASDVRVKMWCKKCGTAHISTIPCPTCQRQKISDNAKLRREGVSANNGSCMDKFDPRNPNKIAPND